MHPLRKLRESGKPLLSLVFERLLLRFGFPLAGLYVGLLHHRPALHHPLYFVDRHVHIG